MEGRKQMKLNSKEIVFLRDNFYNFQEMSNCWPVTLNMLAHYIMRYFAHDMLLLLLSHKTEVSSAILS